MKNVFPEHRREPLTPYDDRGGEALAPPEIDPPMIEPENETARGCGWLLVFILTLVVGIIALVSWGVIHMVIGTTVQPLHQNYRTLSLRPAQRIQAPKAEMQLQIYYVARGRALAAEMRRLRKPATENERLRLIAQELRKPPSGKLLENPLPPGTDIRGVYLLNGIAYVDLTIDFTKVERPTPLRERLAIYALVNSMMLNNRSIQGVQIMIDGRPANSAWGWLDISSPLGPDLSLENPGSTPE